MLSLRRPSTEVLSEFLASQSKLGFTCSAVGATAKVPPAGFDVDHARIKPGEGEQVFTRAKSALGRWDQFRLGWVEAWSPKTIIDTGDVVAVLARTFGPWWLNACRIVYVGPIRSRTGTPKEFVADRPRLRNDARGIAHDLHSPLRLAGERRRAG